MIPSDPLGRLLLVALALATLLPVTGRAAVAAGWIADAAVFALFLLNGIRLPRNDVLGGLSNIRLQGSLFIWVFGVMAAAGFALSQLFDGLAGREIALGFLYLGVLPSTVQSATAYCGLARGNVAASVVAAALLNLAGIVITPVLFSLLAGTQGFAVTSDGAIRILTILLLPFIIGQIVQPWLRPKLLAHRDMANWMDRAAVAIAVYVAFSGAVVEGVWSRISLADWGWLGLGVAAMLALGFGGAWVLGGALKLNPGDRRVMLFSGAQKSLAVGAPLATILFAPDVIGLVLMPIITYHLCQLLLSAPIAQRLAAEMEAELPVTASSSA